MRAETTGRGCGRGGRAHLTGPYGDPMKVMNALRRWTRGSRAPQGQTSTLGLDPFEPWVDNRQRRESVLESFEGLALRRAFFG